MTRNSAETSLLVVGGSGFIGQHVVADALALGWQVTSLSLTGKPKVSLPNVQYLAADMAKRKLLNSTLAGKSFDYVVNCSGYIDHTLYLRGGRRLIESGFFGLLNLVEALDRDRLKGYVHIGSSDEYGGSPAPQVETQRESPISPYSLAKVAACHFLQELYRTEGFPATILRIFLAYGPGQTPPRFLPGLIKGCLRDEHFPVSAGEQMRDFCFVKDVTKAIFAALSAPAAGGEVINIGSGKPVTIRSMIEVVQKMIGKGQPDFGRIPYRPGENMALYPDISKAARILGWIPTTTLEEGLAQTIAWVRSQDA